MNTNETTPTDTPPSEEYFELHFHLLLMLLQPFAGFRRSEEYFAYEAVWALVKALDALNATVYENFDPFNVRNQTNRKMGEMIRDSLQTLSFTTPSVSQCDLPLSDLSLGCF